METVTVVLVLLVAVVVSSSAARITPIPLPIVQIGLGAALALLPLPTVSLDPETFFLVFLPPLLFLDAWRIPKRALVRDGGVVLALSIGLVLFTVAGMGLFIHALIPAMPLAVAVALAAVLSPTDPVAVSAVAARVAIPRRLMHILEGEALLNDASGLVCLRFAVAAALTGSFSPLSAFGTFLWLVAGGIGIGIAGTLLVTELQGRLIRRLGEDPGTQTLFSLLIPFCAYALAERVGASGILAAVAAGGTMNLVENRGRALALTRLRRTAVWDTVQLAANGAIFVLLGEQLPGILADAMRATGGTGWGAGALLSGYVAAITLGLMVLRFAWSFVTLRFGLTGGGAAGGVTWHLVLVTTLSGVRGAVTLAGILGLPLALPDGAPFPARTLAICIAVGVILLSLAIASALLPLLLPHLQLAPEPEGHAEEDAVREAAAKAARRVIERLQAELEKDRGDADIIAEAAAAVLQRYDRRPYRSVGSDQADKRGRERAAIEQRLRVAGLRAERHALFGLSRRRRIGDGLLRRLVREIDLAEARNHTDT